MTIIAYRDGVMAADTATWQGGVMIGDRSKKIMRTPEGFLIACAGELSVISKFRAWAKSGFKEDETADFQQNVHAMLLSGPIQSFVDHDGIFDSLPMANDRAVKLMSAVNTLAKYRLQAPHIIW